MGPWYCIIYIALLGVLSFLIGRVLPKRWFRAELFPYKSYPFEKNGRIYDRIRIKAWQNKVPDMSKVFRKLMPAKKLEVLQADRIELMIQETCIAELIHSILCVLGLYCLRLWPGAGGIIVTAIYILAGNLPFILIQRYNRPRMVRIMKKLSAENKAVDNEQVQQYANAYIKL